MTCADSGGGSVGGFAWNEQTVGKESDKVYGKKVQVGSSPGFDRWQQQQDDCVVKRQSITIVRPAGRREEREARTRAKRWPFVSGAWRVVGVVGLGWVGSTGGGVESRDGRLAGTYTRLNVWRQRRGVHCRTAADRMEGETNSLRWRCERGVAQK